MESTIQDMANIPQALHKEIDECNEMELQQAQTWLLSQAASGFCLAGRQNF